MKHFFLTYLCVQWKAVSGDCQQERPVEYACRTFPISCFSIQNHLFPLFSSCTLAPFTSYNEHKGSLHLLQLYVHWVIFMLSTMLPWAKSKNRVYIFKHMDSWICDTSSTLIQVLILGFRCKTNTDWLFLANRSVPINVGFKCTHCNINRASVSFLLWRKK